MTTQVKKIYRNNMSQKSMYKKRFVPKKRFKIIALKDKLKELEKYSEIIIRYYR